MKEDLIAPCGMNCSLCISYQAMTNDMNKKGFHKKYCQGCIPRGENCTHMGDACDLLKEGKVRFCYECNSFPCKRLKSLDKRYSTKYRMSMIRNLGSIRDEGMEVFLDKEAEIWKCAECGGIICCHNGLCLNCDMDKLVLCKSKKRTIKE